MSSQDDNDVIGFIAGVVETLRDQMATKGDIGRLSDKLEVATTSIRGDIEQVQLRLEGIEHTLSSRLEQIEGDLSRLRSVVYLLVKDKPEILRLLGQSSA